MKPSRFAILCTVLALAACRGESKKATGGKAGGEILPASASDAMLPYDTVRSQAPLAPGGEGDKDGKDKKDVKPADKEKAKAAPKPKPAEPDDADE